MNGTDLETYQHAPVQERWLDDRDYISFWDLDRPRNHDHDPVSSGCLDQRLRNALFPLAEQHVRENAKPGLVSTLLA